jgi:hypothetical protein
VIVTGSVTAVGLASRGVADPTADGESAAAVIVQLQEQGFLVTVNGAQAGDTSLLTTCTVTSIQNSGAPTIEPAKTRTVNVSVACPITHG